MSVQGLNVEVLVNGGEAGPELRRITVAFERAGEGVADFSKNLFPKLAPIFEAEERKQFDVEGAGPTGSWAELSPAYAKSKEARYPGQPLLRATNVLFDALTNPGSLFAERSFSADQFNFGTSGVVYASYLQLGTTRMVARQPFDFSSDFERELQDATLESVRDAVRQSGLAEFVEGP